MLLLEHCRHSALQKVCREPADHAGGNEIGSIHLSAWPSKNIHDKGPNLKKSLHTRY